MSLKVREHFGTMLLLHSSHAQHRKHSILARLLLLTNVACFITTRYIETPVIVLALLNYVTKLLRSIHTCMVVTRLILELCFVCQLCAVLNALLNCILTKGHRRNELNYNILYFERSAKTTQLDKTLTVKTWDFELLRNSYQWKEKSFSHNIFTWLVWIFLTNDTQHD